MRDWFEIGAFTEAKWFHWFNRLTLHFMVKIIGVFIFFTIFSAPLYNFNFIPWSFLRPIITTRRSFQTRGLKWFGKGQSDRREHSGKIYAYFLHRMRILRVYVDVMVMVMVVLIAFVMAFRISVVTNRGTLQYIGTIYFCNKLQWRSGFLSSPGQPERVTCYTVGTMGGTIACLLLLSSLQGGNIGFSAMPIGYYIFCLLPSKRRLIWRHIVGYLVLVQMRNESLVVKWDTITRKWFKTSDDPWLIYWLNQSISCGNASQFRGWFEVCSVNVCQVWVEVRIKLLDWLDY